MSPHWQKALKRVAQASRDTAYFLQTGKSPVSLFEIKASSRQEFDRIFNHMKQRGIKMDDFYEPDYKILARLSKRQREDLETRGVSIRGMRDSFYG